jgi:hypothetical protein
MMKKYNNYKKALNTQKYKNKRSMDHIAHLSHLGSCLKVSSISMQFIPFCSHKIQFHVTYKGSNCLGIPAGMYP